MNNMIMHLKERKLLKNLLVVFSIMLTCLIISSLFRLIGFHESNIIIVFLLGVLFVSRLTDGYWGGILSSFIGVTLFNFFFTEPYYTLQVDRSDYPITFIIMLIAAVITSTSTSIIKLKVIESNRRENNINLLYNISHSILKAHNASQIVSLCGELLAEALDTSCMISLKNNGVWETPRYFTSNTIADQFDNFQNQIEALMPLASQTQNQIKAGFHFEYIKSPDNEWGVIAVKISSNDSNSKEQVDLIKSICSQVAVALERERLSQVQHEIMLQNESERLKSDLLRSISHDLRTPLTGIMGAASTLIDNQNEVSKGTSFELIKIIHDDANWLINTIENILSLTKIDEQKFSLTKNWEIVDELFENALNRLSRQYDVDYVNVILPDEIIEVDVDRLLINQVIINILENAFKYADYQEGINVKVFKESTDVVFEISDYGPGIRDVDHIRIFERFYSAQSLSHGERKGIGLGLPICKSIIEVHGGKIEALSNDHGGTTIRFTLPGR